MKKIKKILASYCPEDADELQRTVEELCSKGVAKGCFQDFGMVADVITCLYALVDAVRKDEFITELPDESEDTQ